MNLSVYKLIYHVTEPEDWQKWANWPTYESPSLHTEGFIHCCTPAQLPGVLERYFAGKTNLRLLTLDVARLQADLRYEPATNDERFPHLYGPINKEAIVAVDIHPAN